MKVELPLANDLLSGIVRTRRTWLRTERRSLQVICQVLLAQTAKSSVNSRLWWWSSRDARWRGIRALPVSREKADSHRAPAGIK